MAKYRKFWIVNSLGNRYDLTDESQFHALSEPEGLGFQRKYETKKVGNSETVVSQEFTLTDIEGEILFYATENGTNYQEYQNFIQFMKYKPLEFHYLPPNVLNDYFCEIIFEEAKKSEVSEDHVLHVPVKFHRLTEWLTSNDNTIILTNTPIDEGKYYELVRDYHYAGTNLSKTRINNAGTDDIGFVFQVDGECQNMMFSITQGGDTYGICKILGTYDFIRIDSVEKTENIYLERNGSVITNPEAYQDFTVADGNAYITWCKFRVGESILNITMGNIDTFDGKIIVSFKNSYATV